MKNANYDPVIVHSNLSERVVVHLENDTLRRFLLLGSFQQTVNKMTAHNKRFCAIFVRFCSLMHF